MGLFGGKKKEDAVPPMQAQPPMPNQMPPGMGVSPSQPIDPMNPQPLPPQPNEMPPMGPDNMQQPMQAQYSPEPSMSVEETVEAIIDEKWNDLLKDINKIIEWKERTEATMSRVQQEIADLKNNFEALSKSIMSKISSYDQNIRNVGVDIKAMEQVFQRILPKFTDNVNKLSRITDKVSRN